MVNYIKTQFVSDLSNIKCNGGVHGLYLQNLLLCLIIFFELFIIICFSLPSAQFHLNPLSVQRILWHSHICGTWYIQHTSIGVFVVENFTYSGIRFT